MPAQEERQIMRRFVAVALLATLLAGLPAVASAASISPGCRQVNSAVNDGYYAAKELAAFGFFEGEVIRVRAGDPSDGATFVHLLVDQVIVAEAAFPGRTLFAVPADGDYVVGWDAGGDATWRVSCAAPTKPFAPQGPMAQPGDGQAMVSWGEPAFAGGAPIDDYRLQYRLRGGHHWTDYPDGVSAICNMYVEGLTNGRTYQFRVAAHNSYGWGPWSAPAMVKVGTPAGPQGPTTTPGDGQVQLNWGEPLSAGAGPITDYVIQRRLKGENTWAPVRDGRSTECHAYVLGLTNGATYEFRIAARNSFGRGPWSEIVEGAPAA